MASPRPLLIDELSLGLAPKGVDELVDALRTVNAEGTSLLVVCAQASTKPPNNFVSIRLL